jgi:hypothetical protein
MFHNVSFNFATAISKFDTFSSFHIVRTRIAKVTASFSLYALSELVCTKKYFTLFYYSLLIHPKLIPFWSVTDRQTEGQNSSPTLLSVFFFYTERAGRYLLFVNQFLSVVPPPKKISDF